MEYVVTKRGNIAFEGSLVECCEHAEFLQDEGDTDIEVITRKAYEARESICFDIDDDDDEEDWEMYVGRYSR